MVVVAGTVKIKPERREEAQQLALRMATATRAESGCLTYQFYADLTDPATFFLFEEWENDEALNRHFQTPHMAEFQKHLPGLLAGPINVKRYTIQTVSQM